MEKDKILLVAANNLAKGGVQNVIMEIVRNLSNVFQFDIILFDNESDIYDSEFESFGGKIYRVKCYSGENEIIRKLQFYTRGQYFWHKSKRIIQNGGPYVAIHSHKMDESAPFLNTAKRCGVPVRIAHAHTAFQRKYNPIAKVYVSILRKLLIRNATDFIACSEKAGAELFGDHPFRVIYNTIERRFLDAGSKSELHDAPILLQVGMICDNKNQLFSLSVLQALREYYPASKLVFVGAAKDREMDRYFARLTDCIRHNNLDDAVSFLPADSDVKAEMENADYLLMPSQFEGLGIAVLEAQARGMKCFVSSAVPEKADCGGCVFLDLADGANVWAKRIAEQFESDHGAHSSYDLSRFHPDVIMGQYRKLYRGELF